MTESRVVQKNLPCPDCGSSDALARYDDGHTHCFSCGEHHGNAQPKQTRMSDSKKSKIINGEPEAIKSRGLSEATCAKWGYHIGEMHGKPCQIANYRDGKGKVVAQKIRFPGKDFTWTGEPKKSGLYGQHLWRDGGRMVVVTEGEIDALSVSQLQDNKWPVVSVPNGAQGAAKSIGQAVEWLQKFDHVVFLFDNDEPGRAAAVECATLLQPGKAKIATLPLKDANDMLVAKRGKEVIDALWGAKLYRPDGIIDVDDILEQAKKPVEWGLSWPWPKLTELTYGVRTRECYGFGAGVGAGKTDAFTQIAAHFITEHKEPVGCVYLEQNPVETAKRIAGKIAGKVFHVPDAGWKQQELDMALESLRGQVHFYNHFGSTEWDVIKGLIRHMAVGLGIKRIFLDHLTALVSHAEDERRALDALMAELAGLCQQLDITIFFISHLTTPEGTSHEEGGRIEARHFRGSRAIMQWANFMFGLERDQQADDPVLRQTTTLRVLKDRNTGRGTGATLQLRYDRDSGHLNEVDGDGDFAFKDETDTAQHKTPPQTKPKGAKKKPAKRDF